MMLGILFSAICTILTPIVVQESKFPSFHSIFPSLFSSVSHEFFGIHYIYYAILGERYVMRDGDFEQATAIYQATIIQRHNQFL